MTSSADSPGVRLPPPLLYLVVLVVGIVANRWLPHPDHLPIIVRTIGWLFIGMGALLTISGIYAMRRARTTIRPDRGAATLVTNGIFRYTRNPLYLSLTAFYTGVACVANAPWALILLPVLVWIMQVVVIRSEEAYLTRAFGTTYTAYCGRVRRWI